MANAGNYDWAFKRAALDAVLDEYASFFRVATHIEDTRTLFLLAMCAMIDLAAHRAAKRPVRGEANQPVPENPWDLDLLLAVDKSYFSHVNWPGNDRSLSAEQRYRRLLRVLHEAPFI